MHQYHAFRTAPVCQSIKLVPSPGGSYSSSREFRRPSRGVLVSSVSQTVRRMTRHQPMQVTALRHRLPRRPRRSRPQLRPPPHRQRHPRSQRRRPCRPTPRPRLRRQRRLNQHHHRLEEAVDRPRPLMVLRRRRPKRRRRRQHRHQRRRPQPHRHRRRPKRRHRRQHRHQRRPKRRRRRPQPPRPPNLILPTGIPRGMVCLHTARLPTEDLA